MRNITKRAETISAVVDGQSVVCDLRSGELFHLNAVGSLIWDACDGRSTDGVIDYVRGFFVDADPGQITADVLTFLETLHQKDLTEVG